MARRMATDTIIVKPRNNVYTALVAASIVVEIVGLVALYMRHSALFGKGLFGQ